jgi:hypothetical protein
MNSWLALFLLQTDMLMLGARLSWDARQLTLDALRRAMS